MRTTTIEAEDGTTLALDVTLAISRSRSAAVTQHPVEQGAAVADHAQVQSDVVTLSVVVSKTPFESTSSTGGDERLREVVALLQANIGKPCTVVDSTIPEGRVENVVLTRAPESYSVVKRLGLDLEFVEVRFASVSSVEIPPRAPAQGAQGSAPDGVESGEQPTEEATEQEDETSRSTLRAGVDKLRG